MDARAKLLGVLAFAVAVSLLTDARILAVALGFSMSALALARVRARSAAGRYAMALPFILFAALTQYLTSGPPEAITMTLRLSAAVLALIFLGLTTPFHDILWGLQALGMPRLITGMLLLIHRYISVLGDELARMRLARSARAYRPAGHMLSRHTMRTISNTAGMLLVRAYHRGLRVQDGLRARGFDGHFRRAAHGRGRRAESIALASCFWGISLLMLIMQWVVAA